MKDKLILLFDKYYRYADLAAVGLNKNLAVQAKSCIEKADFLLNKATAAESEMKELRELDEQERPPIEQLISGEATWKPSRERAKRTIQLMFECETFTEAYYYFSHRARVIIRSLPLLHKFECEGVREVRNHLIEHPEGKASGVTMHSFGFLGPNGPVVKAARYDYQKELKKDAGLYANAEEFSRNLTNALEKAIAELPSPC